jgi:hypothetical protein
MHKEWMFQSLGKGEERKCVGLHATLCLFTSQFMTRSGCQGLRKFINSSMENIHDPAMLARYVIAPVNHLLLSQWQILLARHNIPVDAPPWQKLNWIGRHVLFSQILSILDKYGLQPECQYTSDHDQKELVRWVVEDSPWGKKQSTRCTGTGSKDYHWEDATGP